jgi:hypothetical protein
MELINVLLPEVVRQDIQLRYMLPVQIFNPFYMREFKRVGS